MYRKITLLLLTTTFSVAHTEYNNEYQGFMSAGHKIQEEFFSRQILPLGNGQFFSLGRNLENYSHLEKDTLDRLESMNLTPTEVNLLPLDQDLKTRYNSLYVVCKRPLELLFGNRSEERLDIFMQAPMISPKVKDLARQLIQLREHNKEAFEKTNQLNQNTIIE